MNSLLPNFTRVNDGLLVSFQKITEFQCRLYCENGSKRVINQQFSFGGTTKYKCNIIIDWRVTTIRACAAELRSIIIRYYVRRVREQTRIA